MKAGIDFSLSSRPIHCAGDAVSDATSADHASRPDRRFKTSGAAASSPGAQPQTRRQLLRCLAGGLVCLPWRTSRAHVTGLLTEPRAWHRLFERPPRDISFPDQELLSDWEFDRQTATLAVNSQQYAVFLAHTTILPAYRVQLSVSHNSCLHGVSGLILGYCDKAARPNRFDATFQTVGLRNVDAQKFMIQRDAVRIRRTGDGLATFSVHSIGAVRIEMLHYRNRMLEVVVRDDKVDQIFFDGQPLDELLERDPYVKLPFEPAATGGIGVINGHADATFGDLRFIEEATD